MPVNCVNVLQLRKISNNKYLSMPNNCINPVNLLVQAVMCVIYYVYILAGPVCFSTAHCGRELVSDNILPHQCCRELFSVSFLSSGQCYQCPEGT